MNNLTFGRYSPYNSFVHKLDPRNKLFILVLLIISIFLQFHYWSTTLLLSGAFLILFILLMIISRVSFIQLFKSMKTLWFLIVFLLVIYIFIPNNNYIHEWYRFNAHYALYWDSLYQVGYIILRIILMFCLTMILTSTTKPMDLTYAFEWYMTPLKIVRFPVHETAMTLSIALRFIPTLLDETERIMKAQESRGVDFAHGGLGKKFKAVISLIIPLFVSAIQRSEELSDAMEARGYDPRAKRTKYRKLTFSWRDAIALLLGLAIFGGVLYLFILDRTGQNVYLLQWIFRFEWKIDGILV